VAEERENLPRVRGERDAVDDVDASVRRASV
jgi:hypothetical protein